MCHAIERAQERWGITLTTWDLRDISDRISNNDETVQHDPKHHDMWHVLIGHRWIPVIFEGGQIVTVLPADYGKERYTTRKSFSKKTKCNYVEKSDCQRPVIQSRAKGKKQWRVEFGWEMV